MKTYKNSYLAVAILILIIFFAGMIIFAVPSQTITAKADDHVSPFMGQDSNLTLSQKSSAINYSSGSSSIPMLTVLSKLTRRK